MSLTFKACPTCGCLTLYGIPVMPKQQEEAEAVSEQGRRPLATKKPQATSLSPAPQRVLATKGRPAYYSPVTDAPHDCATASTAWDALGLAHTPHAAA